MKDSLIGLIPVLVWLVIVVSLVALSREKAIWVLLIGAACLVASRSLRSVVS